MHEREGSDAGAPGDPGRRSGAAAADRRALAAGRTRAHRLGRRRRDLGRGVFGGTVKATGKSFEMEICNVMHVDGGKIVAWESYGDVSKVADAWS